MSKSSSAKSNNSFGFMGFLWRLIASLALVLISFNPSGYSYFHWFTEAFSGEGAHAIHYFAGAILLTGWAVFVKSTIDSLGSIGTILSVAIIGTGIWLLIDLGMIDAGSTSAITWLLLIALAILLAAGLSWAHLKRRITGQVEVDDVEG